jgi:hypothetical protein
VRESAMLVLLKGGIYGVHRCDGIRWYDKKGKATPVTGREGP